MILLMMHIIQAITVVILDHVCTTENLADLLMKGLTRGKFYNTSKKMGLMAIDK